MRACERKYIFLQIIATDKVFFKGPCQKLIILLDGEKEVLPHHEDMVNCSYDRRDETG